MVANLYKMVIASLICESISVFFLFTQQRKDFYSTERTFSPKQLQNAPKKDSNLRLFKKDAKVGGSSFFLLDNIRFFFNFYILYI